MSDAELLAFGKAARYCFPSPPLCSGFFDDDVCRNGFDPELGMTTPHGSETMANKVPL